MNSALNSGKLACAALRALVYSTSAEAVFTGVYQETV